MSTVEVIIVEMLDLKDDQAQYMAILVATIHLETIDLRCAYNCDEIGHMHYYCPRIKREIVPIGIVAQKNKAAEVNMLEMVGDISLIEIILEVMAAVGKHKVEFSNLLKI